MQVKDLNAVVVGGAGLIGSHIVDLLVERGARSVTVYDNFTRGTKENLEDAGASGRLRVIEADLRDPKAVSEAIAGCDIVFHQAALPLLDCEREPRAALEINVMGTWNVLEACAAHKVKKVVFASSSSVYGEGRYLPTDEAHPFDNDLFYGASKVADEQVARAFSKKFGIPTVGFRYLNVYGPRQDFRSAYVSVIMRFLNQIEAGESPTIDGDGSATLDLVHVKDVARANVVAMESDVSGMVFNVASGKETTVKELLDLMQKVLGKNVPPIYRPRDARLVVRRLGCPKLAAEKLGFRCEISNEEGLRSVVEWRNKMKARGAAAQKA